MSNHNPTFTSSAASTSFSETANTTNSATPHLATGTLGFRDSDRTDSHTTSASLRTASLSGGGGVPAAALADLNAAMSSSILSDSNGSGVVKWSFSAADNDFDFLAKNQTLTLTYDILVADNHGGSVKQTVTVNVTGTDDKPVIAVVPVATVSEQVGQTLSFSPDTAHLALQFTDPDLANVGHTASVIAASASGATAGLLPGGIGSAELLAFFHIDNVVKASGSANGTINTTFLAPDLAFDYLAAGEHLNITYTVQLDDHAGGVSTQNVIVTIIGTNDAPIYLSGPESAHFTEGQNVTPAGNLVAHGDFLFADLDLSDTHTVSSTVTAVRSGGGSIPLSNAALLAAMSTSVHDSTLHLLGDVDWNFAISNAAVSFLGAGETLTLTYTIKLTDSALASDTQIVTVTILGTNHPVAITSGPGAASLIELADTTGSSLPNSTSPVPTGSLAFTDQDTGDTHAVAVSVASAVWSGGSGVPVATQADLATALATTLHDSTGTGTGSVDWSFSVPDRDLDFLAAGETLAITYNVKVSDAATNAVQTVTVTATGTNDAVTMTSGPQSASLSERPNTTGSPVLDTTSPVPTGTLNFADVDLSDTHQVSVVLDTAVWSFNFDAIPAATLADLQAALITTLHDSTGPGTGGIDWTFSIPDRDLDFLGAGETLTVTYNVTVSDAATSSTQVVTITVNGADDPLVVNSGNIAIADTTGVDAGTVIAFDNLFTTGIINAGDSSTIADVTSVNGNAANVGHAVAGLYGTLVLQPDGGYTYTANSALDALSAGDTAVDHFTFTVVDTHGRTASSTLDFNITGSYEAPQIGASNVFGTVIEDAGPVLLVNGGFEAGNLSGWTASSDVSAEFQGIGGAFGNYTARLEHSGSLTQSVATNAGQHYTLSFVVTGDPEAFSSTFHVSWGGVELFGTSHVDNGFTYYTFDIVGDGSSMPLTFSYSTDGTTGLFLDQVSLQSPTGPATETTDGNIAFSDLETGDTHTASFSAQGTGYVGTFSLDPVTETSGNGSVNWHFTVDNADIQYLSAGQTLVQTYTVLITDDHGVSKAQDVSVAINGANDAPTAHGETVVTDVDANGSVAIPTFALLANDTDPDMLDTLGVHSITGSSGGTAFQSGDVFFSDDATNGGAFTYDVTDGRAVSGAATATVINQATGSATLTGTGGDDIVIGHGSGQTLNGGGGNDVLIGNAGGATLTGGTGNDTFVFQQATGGSSTITDFNNSIEHDRIALSASGLGGGLTAGMDTSFVFESSADGQFASTDSRLHFDTANATLYYSVDGTTASAVALVQLQPGATLHAHDLLVV
ncbi:VCBS domain-containing protein [Bradyrhizobium prioriisuperbiae]|uniref:beta strand repeat-containing protein n=1 Tax=Bradyrhizobium prioriisuperbiae TaxID=2854389 RepID=UPI0028EA3FF5|nr:VCBS domain-containing protein [Bradyrhizobium prioritasuperba]